MPAGAQPATRPALLDEGRVRYVPPAGWELRTPSTDPRTAEFRHADRSGMLMINAMPLAVQNEPEVARQMAMTIGPEMRRYVQRKGYTLELGPRVEPDDRFMLVVHDRMRTDRGVSDRKQMYRSLPGILVYVNATAFTDDPQEAARIHALGAAMLDGATTGSGPRPIAFRFTEIRLAPPADWVIENRQDNPNGLVAIFRPPKPQTERLVIRSKVLPRLARTDPARRQRFVEDMVDAERRQPPLEGLVAVRDLEVLEPDSYIAATRSWYSSATGPLVCQTRYVAVGDGLISVSAVGAEATEQELIDLAERVAGTVEPRMLAPEPRRGPAEPR
jgi:hypothetical protein